MYSEMPELSLIKGDEENLRNFEIMKRPTLKFQSGSTESLSSSSHSQNKEEENYDEEKGGEEQEEEHHLSRIVSKQSDSEASTSSARAKLKVEEEEEEEEEEEDGFRTPTSLDHRIQVAKQCPPAPRKIKPSLKRKASYNHCNCRRPLDLSKEVELLFPTQHIPLPDSHRSTKKVRREEPK